MSDETSSEGISLQLLFAKGLGYLVGFGSLMLYTPIAVRICCQRHANGLVLSTWWLKLSSYLLQDIYYVRKHYDLSTYVETVVITVESVVILAMVAVFQNRTRETSFWVMLGALAMVSLYGFTLAPDSVIATGQISSVFVNTAALIPQFHYNYTTQTKGDYSPVTATLAWLGCLVRIFTTRTLNDGDPVLMVSFSSAFSINLALVLQILYYGMLFEGLTFRQVFSADVARASNILVRLDSYEMEGINGAGDYVETSNGNESSSSNNYEDTIPNRETRPDESSHEII